MPTEDTLLDRRSERVDDGVPLPGVLHVMVHSHRALGAWRLSWVASFLFVLPAHAQLNLAYEQGYRPMLDLGGRLNELVSSAERREDYSSVRDLGNRYVDALDKMIAALENAGRNFRDGDNESWVRAAKSPALAAAKNARGHAEKVRACGDERRNCLGDSLSLQRSLTDLTDEFKKCRATHEERLRDLFERYESTRLKWWESTREDRRPIDDAAKNVTSLRERLNELQARSVTAGKLYMDAQDQCDRARTELFGTDSKRTPDEVRRRYEEWKKAEDLVKRTGELAANLRREVADAERAHADAHEQWRRASENYLKEAAEGDQLYQLVLQRHARLYEVSQEYKSFSM